MGDRVRAVQRRYRWLPDVLLGGLRREAVSALGLSEGDTVLDLGCGAGASFELLQERVGPNGRIVGLDVSPNLLRAARERCDRHGWSNVELLEQDATDLEGFAKFDAVLSFCSHDILQSLEGVARVALSVRQGGVVVAAGLKLARRLPGALLNPIIGLVSLPYVTDRRNAFEPSTILALALPCQTSDRLGGLAYITVARQEMDVKREARDFARAVGPTSYGEKRPHTSVGLWRDDGKEIHPGDACVPILQELAPGRLKVVGTGFWITTYGLFLTARHVLDELVVPGPPQRLGKGFVLHMGEDNKVYLRRIRAICLMSTADLAVGQADNCLDRFPDAPLLNLCGELSMQVPPVGEPLMTYAYPENEILDYTEPEGSRAIRGNYFTGHMLRYVTESEHPFIRHPHFETSIEIRAGASGCPVFDDLGRVVGVSCRGWDFRGAEEEGDQLSYIVPVGELLGLEVDLVQVPRGSPADPSSLPSKLTVLELGLRGHILIGPDLESFARPSPEP